MSASFKSRKFPLCLEKLEIENVAFVVPGLLFFDFRRCRVR